MCAETFSIEDFLKKAAEYSEDLKAADLDIQSLTLEIQARDLELTPTIKTELTKFWDDRPSSSSNPEREGSGIEVTLNKPFATGTALSLVSDVERTEYDSRTDEDNLVNWQLSVTQSLWQNRFGRQTSLRRHRDNYEYQSRMLKILLNRQSTLIELENLYWDIAYAHEELRIRKENLERSQKILSWIQERYDRSAAEHVDLLQAQTLVSSRELQLQSSEDTLKTLLSRLGEKLDLNTEFFPVTEDLKQDRDINSLTAQTDFAPAAPALIETLQEQADADLFKAESDLAIDKIKPVLEAGYTYGQQGLNTSFASARDNAFSKDDNYHEFGVVFSMPLDLPLIIKSNEASRLKTKAQEARSKRSKRQSNLQWADLERMIIEQKKRVQTAQTIAKLQNDKSQEERARYEKGKTTTFQVITFEQDAAESELLVWQLTKQLRQTEAQARSYISHSGGRL